MKKLLKNLNDHADPEGTRILYASLDNHSKDNAAAYNFAKNIAKRESFIKEYFDALGIDPYLFQDLYVSGVNAYQQTVLYWGIYPVKLANNDEVLRFILQRNEKDEPAEMIHTPFGFTLFLDECESGIAIWFEADLPWLLSPNIKRARYENKTVLPEIDVKSLRAAE